MLDRAWTFVFKFFLFVLEHIAIPFAVSIYSTHIPNKHCHWVFFLFFFFLVFKMTLETLKFLPLVSARIYFSFSYNHVDGWEIRIISPWTFLFPYTHFNLRCWAIWTRTISSFLSLRVFFHIPCIDNFSIMLEIIYNLSMLMSCNSC